MKTRMEIIEFRIPLHLVFSQ